MNETVPTKTSLQCKWITCKVDHGEAIAEAAGRRPKVYAVGEVVRPGNGQNEVVVAIVDEGVPEVEHCRRSSTTVWATEECHED